MAPTKRKSTKKHPEHITPIKPSPTGKVASDTHSAIKAGSQPGRGYKVNGKP
jgi:hypothetical protein